MATDLSDRAAGILLALDERTTPAEPGQPSWVGWGPTWGGNGLSCLALSIDVHNSRGVANTLKALSLRGLAENDGGGVFLQNRWRVTQAGAARAEELRASGAQRPGAAGQ